MPSRKEAKTIKGLPDHLGQPLGIGSGGGTRTPDKAVNSRLLYRLSYSRMGTRWGHQSRITFPTGVVEAEAGIEPAYTDLQSAA